MIGRSDCKAVKFNAGIYSRTGTGDIIACVRGRMVVVEVKRPGEEPTAIQLHEGKDWIRAGAVWLCVSSLQEVVDAIESLS